MGLIFEANNFAALLEQALALKIPYGERRREAALRPDAVSAAVLGLFAYSRENPSPHLLFTQRTQTVEHHKGQISFPGGRAELLGGEAEGAMESPETNALRETHEEVGIDPGKIRVLGTLPELATVTGFRVTPVIGVLADPLEEVPLIYQVEETSEAFWVSLTQLAEPGVYRDEILQVGSLRYPIQVFLARDILGNERRIWGATASILKNILDRLQSLS